MSDALTLYARDELVALAESNLSLSEIGALVVLQCFVQNPENDILNERFSSPEMESAGKSLRKQGVFEVELVTDPDNPSMHTLKCDVRLDKLPACDQ